MADNIHGEVRLNLFKNKTLFSNKLYSMIKPPT